MTDHRRPPMPFFHAPAPACRWCGAAEGAHTTHPGGEYAVGGHWHDDCLTAYAISVSSRAQRYFVERRDYGLCAGCGANAERAMHRAMADDPSPPWYGWEIVRVMKRWVDPEFRCVANSTWFRPAKAPPAADLPPWVEWQADHVIPLWSVDRSRPWEEVRRFWSMENLQTLCVDCHARKTAAEAGERAALRRGPDPQLPLFNARGAA